MEIFTDLVKSTNYGLSNMKPGTKVDINRLKMSVYYSTYHTLAVCKGFIDTHIDFELSNDYKYIRRLKNTF